MRMVQLRHHTLKESSKPAPELNIAPVGAIFSGLFPDERFNIESSPLRVQQAIHRTRKWIERAGIPLEIHEKDGFYEPRIGQDLGIGVELERRPADWQSIQFRRLRAVYPSSVFFKAKDAREALGLSEGVFKRFAADLVAEGLIEQTGKSAATRYRVKSAA